jgi:hypothetical protein
LKKTKEKFGGKKITLQKSEFYFANERGPFENLDWPKDDKMDLK